MAFSLDGKLKLDARDFVKGAGKAKGAVTEVGDEFGKLPKEAGKSADGVEEEFGKLPDAGGKIGSDFGGNFGSMLVKGFAAVGAGALIMQGFQSAMDAQAGESIMRGQLDLTAQEAERYGTIAGDLYAEGWGNGLQDVQLTVGKVAKKLGVTTDEELTGISRKVSAVGKTWGADFDAVIRSTDNLIQNDLAPNADEALDLIVTAFQEGGDEAGDLLDTIDEYAPHWAKLGLDGEAAMNQIIAGFKNGQRDADKTADAVKEMALRVVEDTKPITEAYQDLGLDADEMRQKFAEGGPAAREAFKEVLRALLSVEDPVEQNRLAVELIGTQYEDMGGMALETLAAIDAGYVNPTNAAENLTEIVAATPWEQFKREGEVALQRVAEEAIERGGLIDALVGFNAILSGEAFTRDYWKGDDKPVIKSREEIERLIKEIDNTNKAAAVVGDDAPLEFLKVWTSVGEVGDALIEITDEAAVFASESAESLSIVDAAAEQTRLKVQRIEEQFGRMTDKLRDRSAFLDVQDAFADLRAELEETGGVSERTVIGMKQDVIDYATEIGNIPPSYVTKINAAIEEGDIERAESMLAGLERTRNATIRITPIKTGGVTFRDQSGNVIARAYRQGTNNHPGGLALVGEEGPELVNLPRGSQVTRASETAAMLARPVGASSSVVGGTSIALTVNAGMGADGPAIGATIVDHLESFYRSGGTPPRSAVV